MNKTLLKGLAVLLPSIILVALGLWVWETVSHFSKPASGMVSEWLGLGEGLSTVLVLLVFLALCYLLGRIVTTVVGSKLRHLVESKLFDRAPGYAILRNIIGQLFGMEKSPLSSFAMVSFEEAGLRISGFVVEKSEDGWLTVFVPTAPNPTSGFILHVREERVSDLNVPTGEAIESIIGCGAGSTEFHAKVARSR